MPSVDDAGRLLVDREALVGQADEQGLLLGPGLIGHPARGAVHAEVADPGCVVEPDATALVEVVPRGKLDALEKVVPDQAE